MGLDRVSQIIFGIIATMFLLIVLPTLYALISNAGVTDPILQSATYLALLIFVIVTIYVAFKGNLFTANNVAN